MMNLSVLLPAAIFAEHNNVMRVVVDTPYGNMGFLPQRRDCVTPVTAGILTYQCSNEMEHYIAIDTGVLVKTGSRITVSVRHAVSDDNLTILQHIISKQFKQLSEQEKHVRSMFAKIESNFVRSFVEYNHD